MSSSIFSSTVPRHTNLCTSTFFFWPMRIGAIRGLVLHRRVPPPIKVDNVRSGGEIQARASCLEGKHEKSHFLVFLKSAHQLLALAHRGFAMENKAGAPKHRSQESRQRSGYLPELGEDEDLLLPGRDDLGDVAQAGPLAAVFLGPGAVAQPLRGVITDLFESHQECQHDAFALDALGVSSSCSASSFTACW